MNPELFENMLNDYVDGELSAEEAREFEQYLAEHPEAQAELDSLRQLQNEARSLSKNVYPANELWGRIAAEIEPETLSRKEMHAGGAGRVPWRVLLPLAASLLLVFGVVYQSTQTTPTNRTQVNVTDHTEESPDTYHLAVKEYEEARAELVAALEKRLETMSPEIRETVEDNLLIIGGAVKEIQVALEGNPEDSQLMWMLVATQKKELQLLEELVHLPAGA
jgi:anti-sigma factor RsiW